MHYSQIYNEKIPSFIRVPMLEFTDSDCYLVKHRKTGVTSKGTHLNCHRNVQDWVDKKGGHRISGWLLVREAKTIKLGIWVWIFHSIWLTPEGKYADVTMDDLYSGKEFVTFWHDKKRSCDLENGVSYNNIVIFDNQEIASDISRKYKYIVEKGMVYWALSDMSQIRNLDQHIGESKYVSPQYSENLKQLEQKYDAVFLGNELKIKSPIDRSKTDLPFDFFVSP